MNNVVYEKILQFKKKYPLTVAWRIKQHSKLVESFLNPGEEVYYAFAAQKNNNPLDIITTYAVVLTNKRILLAQKRLLFGYFYTAITPDLFNDLKVQMGTNIQKDALDEIETQITEYMMTEKQKYSANNQSRS